MSHIFVLVGASGVGKTTLAKSVIPSSRKLLMPVGVTTRKRRNEEKNGIDYRFISHKTFHRWEKEGKFIETAICRNEHYGLLKGDILDPLDNGFDILTILTPEGLEAFEKLFSKQVTSIFIMPPSKEVLIQRRRKQDNWKVITQEDDIFGMRRSYDFKITNDRLNTACQQIGRIRTIITEGQGG
ncbi:guanylate kinase [Candidatus Liberibacter africanus]|uniref:Guanylate kinase n=1 Tax=Candidatus Liberibacter africanus PTSAPSY TaxID=1277257 RepID=A0A0G3I2I7_LIBAF|nr:guanylate kinase [Candidatus Liberibacter africanus]AKK20094.1 guanylate kinase [Candidatus Liberibacter africanus PTSAPSY]